VEQGQAEFRMDLSEDAYVISDSIPPAARHASRSPWPSVPIACVHSCAALVVRDDRAPLAGAMAEQNLRVAVWVGCEGKGPSMIERIKNIIGIVAGIGAAFFLRQKWNRSTHSINGYGPSLPLLALDTVRPGGVQVVRSSFLRPDKGRPVETRKTFCRVLVLQSGPRTSYVQQKGVLSNLKLVTDKNQMPSFRLMKEDITKVGTESVRKRGTALSNKRLSPEKSTGNGRRCQAGYRTLQDGDRVTFEIVQGPKGPQADNVVKMDGKSAE